MDSDEFREDGSKEFALGGGTHRRPSVIRKNDSNHSHKPPASLKRSRKQIHSQLSESSSASSDDDKHSKKSKFNDQQHDELPSNQFQPVQYYTSNHNLSDTDEEEKNISTNTSTKRKAQKRHAEVVEDNGGDPFDNIKRRFITEQQHASTSNSNEAIQNSHQIEEKNDRVGRMMKNMGYRKGTGLGKHKQGIVEPIESKSIIARSGIGYSIPGLERGKQDWDFEAEEIKVHEEIEWIPIPDHQQYHYQFEELLAWRVIDVQNMDISKCTDFCDADILKDVLDSKSVLDHMDNREFGRARFRSNPFETIGKGIFMNRAALKMANLDAILNFELSNPMVNDRHRISEMGELFYFADVCAGPGGFSEYILWRKGWDAKGFGFTLKGDCDFKLNDFIAGTPESFEPHYGVHDNGDIFHPENIQSFIKYVKDNTDQLGVHLMMADGLIDKYKLGRKSFDLTDLSLLNKLFQGFSVEGQENVQEILSKQLYLSQIVVALAILRTGGHFICKLFDIFTTFSVGLIYLLRLSFDQISIHKPNTSRPANSERYVLCKGKKSNIESEAILKYLLDCHTLMWKLRQDSSTKQDIMELVPLSLLLNDEEFHSYIYKSNNELGKRQIQNLQKIVAFYRDQSLIEKRQLQTKIECLQFWVIPNERRKGFIHAESPAAKFHELLRSDDGSFVGRQEIELNMESMKSSFRSPCDWYTMMVGGDKNHCKRGFYLGLGGSKIFRYNSSRWEPIDIKFDLCKDTLIYGEILNEVYDVRKPMTSRRVAFHIIDGMILGGKDVRGMKYLDRYKICEQFAKAMNKPSIPTLAPVRVKQIVSMEYASSILERLNESPTGSKIYLPINLDDNDDVSSVSPHILVGGMFFIKISNEPWMIARSRRENKLYYYHTVSRKSFFEPFNDVFIDFKGSMENRTIWWWDNYTNFQQNGSYLTNNSNPDKVHIESFLRFIQSIPI